MRTSRVTRTLGATFAATAVAWPATALAQTSGWSVTGAGSGAAPLNQPYDTEYGVGFMGGAGVYRSVLPELEVGLRADAGRISEESEYDGRVGDGGMGFGALSPALRYQPLETLGLESQNGNRGLYLELAGGLSLLEGGVEPIIAPGLGYIFDAGSVGIGPTARYLQVVTGEGDVPGGKDVRIMTVGVELTFGGADTTGGARVAQYQPEPLSPRAETPSQEQPDAQAATGEVWDEELMVQEESDARDQAEDEVPSEEVERVAGQDAGGVIELDERVFFDTGEANLRSDGRQELDRIAERYRTEQGEERWRTLRVSGHADHRGSESLNMELSRDRAEAVRDYLASAGIPADIIDIRAYGAGQPAIAGAQTPAELQANRRVQFEIVLRDEVPRSE